MTDRVRHFRPPASGSDLPDDIKDYIGDQIDGAVDAMYDGTNGSVGLDEITAWFERRKKLPAKIEKLWPMLFVIAWETLKHFLKW